MDGGQRLRRCFQALAQQRCGLFNGLAHLRVGRDEIGLHALLAAHQGHRQWAVLGRIKLPLDLNGLTLLWGVWFSAGLDGRLSGRNLGTGCLNALCQLLAEFA